MDSVATIEDYRYTDFGFDTDKSLFVYVSSYGHDLTTFVGNLCNMKYYEDGKFTDILDLCNYLRKKELNSILVIIDYNHLEDDEYLNVYKALSIIFYNKVCLIKNVFNLLGPPREV